MIRLQSPFEWIDRVFGARRQSGEDRVPPHLLRDDVFGVIDLRAWERLEQPVTLRDSVSSPTRLYTTRVPSDENWLVCVCNTFHTDGATSHAMEIGILNDVGPTSPPPFTPVGGVRLASSTAVAAGPEDKLLVNRPFHVRGGNRLFAQITDSAAFAGEVFLEALLYRLFPGEYVPATPFG